MTRRPEEVQKPDQSGRKGKEQKKGVKRRKESVKPSKQAQIKIR